MNSQNRLLRIQQHICPKQSHPDEIIRQGSLSYRKLTKEHRQIAYDLIASNFAFMEPLTNAQRQKFPDRQVTLSLWKKYWSYFIDEAVTNNISIVVVDTENKDTVAGVIIARDFFLDLEEFQKQFHDKENPISSIMNLWDILMQKVNPITKNIIYSQRTVQMEGFAINPDYKGRKILRSMIRAQSILAKKAGYKYSLVCATNGRSSSSLRSLGYEEIARVDARMIRINGVQPFSSVEQLSRYPAFWMNVL